MGNNLFIQVTEGLQLVPERIQNIVLTKSPEIRNYL